ncbi:uncharacterized protein N7473_005288 [Penicillium subrubescens]|uniref:Uncharacterized protein n=1 Tax=Penicillium subrubescens TaxID=1316194 RepID=A0A1Q5UM54_9EURO|nr:uncharacterized protein N7473_005288 [Penicillium subrubescens]KAJ5895889.1 hypothetical protein N7473_005288 [Penicillium subrubescens]OKP13575.1 hypothetical protein PENSUB_766 [Penicillium subrubescens]
MPWLRVADKSEERPKSMTRSLRSRRPAKVACKESSQSLLKRGQHVADERTSTPHGTVPRAKEGKNQVRGKECETHHDQPSFPRQNKRIQTFNSAIAGRAGKEEI